MRADGTSATGLHVPWEEFRGANRWNREVDVLVNPFELLIGEPDVTLSRLANNAKRGSESRKPAPRSLPSKSIGGIEPRDGPLPERILIHSKEILEILNYISEGSIVIHSHLVTSILRPFKMLAYYEHQIHEHAATLEAKFGQSAAANSEAALKTPGSSGEAPKDEDPRTKSDKASKDGVSDDSSDSGSDNSSDDNTKDSSEKRESFTALLHMRCLLEFLDNVILAKKNHLMSQQYGSVTFSDIWYLFQPGTEVIDQDNKQAYRVLRVTMPKHKVFSLFSWLRGAESEGAEEKPAMVHCIYIDFDGEKIGPVAKVFDIQRFDQAKPIKSLPIYPLRMVMEVGFRDGLIKRGKMLWDVIQIKPMYYKRYTIETREEADSQVMIDFNEALSHAQEHGKDWEPKVDFISTTTEETKEDNSGCEANCCRDQAVHDDSYIDDKQEEDFIKSLLVDATAERRSLIIYPSPLREMLVSKRTPIEDEFAIMSYRVFGFILRSRKWGE